MNNLFDTHSHEECVYVSHEFKSRCFELRVEELFGTRLGEGK